MCRQAYPQVLQRLTERLNRLIEELGTSMRQAFSQVLQRLAGLQDRLFEFRNAGVRKVLMQVVHRIKGDRFLAAGILFAFLVALLVSARLHPGLRAGRLQPPPGARPQAGVSGPISYNPLRQEVLCYIASQPGTYAVYFKDLASGQVMGINENTPIPAASCIKVPVVLYLYEQVAAGKLRWRDRVAYRQDVDYEQGAGALQLTAEDGNTFSLRCLSTIAITISDNIAHNMLVHRLGYDNVMNFIESIASDTPRPYGSGPSTARDLGAFMEAVYRFAKRNPAQGRRLINDLGNTIFHVGLPGELPPDLLVAHKEGSISGVVNDMGIIFANRPYVLTVMSQGISDEDAGFKTIAEISRIVYDYQQKLPPAPSKVAPEK